MENRRHGVNFTQKAHKRESIDKFQARRPYKKKKYRKGKEKEPKGKVSHYGDGQISESSMEKYNLPNMRSKRFNNKKKVKRNYYGDKKKRIIEEEEILAPNKKPGRNVWVFPKGMHSRRR